MSLKYAGSPSALGGAHFTIWHNRVLEHADAQTLDRRPSRAVSALGAAVSSMLMLMVRSL